MGMRKYGWFCDSYSVIQNARKILRNILCFGFQCMSQYHACHLTQKTSPNIMLAIVMKFELGIRQNLLFSQFSLNKTKLEILNQLSVKSLKKQFLYSFQKLISSKSSILPTLITLLSQTYANINDNVLLENTGATSSHLPSLKLSFYNPTINYNQLQPTAINIYKRKEQEVHPLIASSVGSNKVTGNGFSIKVWNPSCATSSPQFDNSWLLHMFFWSVHKFNFFV